ncbi:hypothetical protein CMV_013023 [Castanea mollissima]|uniref:Uncharacterized protein n=1 Tax=Castanea mollissima TaxID=60419 RepID=A0A8J4VMA9_9ROSI|nr:hypothetical protein CMV_013023 [Castanea mollissima]
MGSPHHPSLNPMPMQLSPPHNHPLSLDHLNQLMSCLSIKTTNNEEVTYVRIPIHPWTLVAWSQMTKTPSLPLWLDSSTHHHHRRNFRGHAFSNILFEDLDRQFKLLIFFDRNQGIAFDC